MATAVAPMRMSYGPMGVPVVSNVARIRAAICAISAVKGRVLVIALNSANCCDRFSGAVDLAIPTSKINKQMTLRYGPFAKGPYRQSKKLLVLFPGRQAKGEYA